jgi:phosphosulfolactate synthase
MTKPFSEYLQRIGVPDLPAATVPFDPGLAPCVLESHLEQSAHLMLELKISMSCWMVADEAATRRKLRAANRAGVAAVAGGGPYEVAVAQGALEPYLELCAELGFTAVECGAGFTQPDVTPDRVAERARAHGLEIEFELGGKHDGPFDARTVERLVREGELWLAAGARRLVVEARESAVSVGVFDALGRLNERLAEGLVEGLGMERLVFEAPDKPSQFALLSHFGPEIRLSNVRLEELLRVEIYRRGLHSDSFGQERLRPAPAQLAGGTP